MYNTQRWLANTEQLYWKQIFAQPTDMHTIKVQMILILEVWQACSPKFFVKKRKVLLIDEIAGKQN